MNIITEFLPKEIRPIIFSLCQEDELTLHRLSLVCKDFGKDTQHLWEPHAQKRKLTGTECHQVLCLAYVKKYNAIFCATFPQFYESLKTTEHTEDAYESKTYLESQLAASADPEASALALKNLLMKEMISGGSTNKSKEEIKENIERSAIALEMGAIPSAASLQKILGAYFFHDQYPLEVIFLLLESLCEHNVALTPDCLTWGIRLENLSVAKMIMKNFSNGILKTEDYTTFSTEYPSNLLTNALKNSDVECARMLLELGPDLTTHNQSVKNVLSAAASSQGDISEFVELFKLATSCGAQISLDDLDPLLQSKNLSNAHIVEMLDIVLEHGQFYCRKLLIDDGLCTSIGRCKASNEIIELLIRKGVTLTEYFLDAVFDANTLSARSIRLCILAEAPLTRFHLSLLTQKLTAPETLEKLQLFVEANILPQNYIICNLLKNQASLEIIQYACRHCEDFHKYMCIETAIGKKLSADYISMLIGTTDEADEHRVDSLISLANETNASEEVKEILTEHKQNIAPNRT